MKVWGEVADNFDRPLSIGGAAVDSDILGNRLLQTSGSETRTFTWDVLGRMASTRKTFQSTQLMSATYVYRADGMRVGKSVTQGPGTETTVYRYDGQTAVQDVEVAGASTTVTDYGLGARGVDAVFRTDSSGVAVGYPVYDSHGNRVATLTKSGMSWSLSDERSYDAWGSVRTGAATGRPRARYVASIGHVQDDESGLIYMRARYYEPTNGRFVSEDPAKQGKNWQAYCANDPINFSDSTGLIVDPMIAMLDGVELETSEAIAAQAMGNGMMNMLIRAVANYTLRQVAALASAGVAASQQFATKVGSFDITYKLGNDTEMGAFAILTKIKDAAGNTVFFGITSGNDAGIYNLHIKMMDMEHWVQQFTNL